MAVGSAQCGRMGFTPKLPSLTTTVFRTRAGSIMWIGWEMGIRIWWCEQYMTLVKEGGEICLSYFPVNWSYKDRQKRLLEDYGFVCECDRCQVEKTWKENEGDYEDEECMEEEDEELMEEEEDNGGGGDFPHAYFFVNYVCEKENCGGTLAPLPPSEDGSISNMMECNVCGQLKTKADSGGDSSEDGVMVDE